MRLFDILNAIGDKHPIASNVFHLMAGAASSGNPIITITYLAYQFKDYQLDGSKAALAKDLTEFALGLGMAARQGVPKLR